LLVRHHVAAIVAMGGWVELESSRWSLLRWVDRRRFGLQASKVEVPAAALAEAIPHLRALRGVQELCVTCDGACDLYPVFDRLRIASPAARIVLLGRLPDWPSTEAWQRFLRKLDQTSEENEPLTTALRDGLKGRESDPIVLDHYEDQYHVISLPDGSVAEVLVLAQYTRFRTCWSAAALLFVRDTFVDAKPLWTGKVPIEEYRDTGVCVFGQTVVGDLDGDGLFEVAFELRQDDPACLGLRPVRLVGDTRNWNCVFHIDASALRPFRQANE
jgi:hypothetical protein